MTTIVYSIVDTRGEVNKLELVADHSDNFGFASQRGSVGWMNPPLTNGSGMSVWSIRNKISMLGSKKLWMVESQLFGDCGTLWMWWFEWRIRNISHVSWSSWLKHRVFIVWVLSRIHFSIVNERGCSKRNRTTENFRLWVGNRKWVTCFLVNSQKFNQFINLLLLRSSAMG